MKRYLLAILLCWCSPASAATESMPVFPLKASDDGRYLVDARGVPFFIHADTVWQAPKRLTTAEFGEYLDHRANLGFNAVMLHTFSREVTPDNNRNGDRPFNPPDDISAPNEPYWKQLDAMLELAEQRGFLACIAPLWIRWGGRDTAGWRAHFHEDLAPGYGQFLGSRYAARQNIMWVLGGDANPQEKTHAIDKLGKAIKATAPHHLITVHNRPDNSSAAFFDAATWLDVNMAYSYRETYFHVGGEWNRLGKRRPIFLGESGYEEESNDGRGGSPHRVRRQAYGAILSGALAGHAYGHKNLWHVSDQWRAALEAPGSQQMAHVKRAFTSVPWYQLVPEDRTPPKPAEFAAGDGDVRDQLIVSGRGFFGDDDYVSAAVSKDCTFALVYLPAGRKIRLNLARFTGKVNVVWFDPTNGSAQQVEGSPFRREPTDFTPPQKNAAGDSDWLLVLSTEETEKSTAQ